jgi:cellulose synthase/poly-beta-1,6-N-acetylglucosamine synthase-like glycosyltransferase
MSLNNNPRGIKCTLVTPLKNERDNIEQLWEAIHAQTLPPIEWIITDNGSDDGTYEWLVENADNSPLKVKVLLLPNKTIARMMNLAIEGAGFPIIACCHGGTKIPPAWLANLLRPLIDDPTVEVVAGVWEPYGETSFEQWAARAMTVDVEKINEANFLPASRSVAFTRDAWRKVGGFPEWLPKFGEDTLFAIRLHAARCKFAIARDAIVGWRPKSSPRSLFRQYRLYGEANGSMGLEIPCFRKFLQPWGVVLASLAIGVLSGSFALGVAFFLACLGADIYRKGFFRRGMLPSYFILTWVIAIGYQVGIVQGTLQRRLGQTKIPDSDKQAVEFYQSLL